MSARQLATLLLAACLAAAAQAESLGSAASSASSAGSASSGSLSDSVNGSSRSSTGKQVADGDYRVIEMAEAAGKPGFVQLRLRAVEAEVGEFTLTLPAQALRPQALGVGDVVHARNRVWGLEFARTLPTSGAGEPFFLALNDEALRDLRSHALSL